MIKALILCAMISGEIEMAMPTINKTEARRRGKGQKGRRRGGSGLRKCQSPNIQKRSQWIKRNQDKRKIQNVGDTNGRSSNILHK